MKHYLLNKTISMAVLISLFFPLFSGAYMVVPSINLTVIVNTEGQENNFNFKVQEYYETFWNNVESFSAQTQNLTAQYNNPNFTAFTSRRIIQETPLGYRLDSVNCISENINNLFAYQLDGVTITPQPWTNVICTFNNKKIADKTPVLIVPGIMGTEMEKNGELLWADLPRMANPFNTDSFMDPLAFMEDLAPSDLNVSVLGVIKKKTTPIKDFDYTEGLIAEFTAQGYIEGETLFTFPYDWRYGVSGEYTDGTTNVDLLKDKINSILAQTGASKVDVVAHSMGGLIVKKYVMENTATQKINKAVLVGVPNLGAPEAIKTLIQGDNMGIPFLNDAEVKKISANMPGAYDLLPSQAYYSKVGSFVETVDMPNIFDPNWQFGTPAVVKNLNYQEFENYLTQDKNLNNQAFNNSEALRSQTFDDYDVRTAGVNIFSINGCKTATMSNITQIKDTNIFGKETISYKNVKFIVGDGTVPITSASNLPIDQVNKYYSLTADHGKMPSQDGVRQQIVNLISGNNLAVDSSLITQDATKCQLNGKVIGVFSPVDIFVQDQFGNRLGLAEDKSIINEIPGANFEILGEHKFLFLPTDAGQTYITSLTGTGSGTYTITVDNIQNTQTTKTESFINLPVTTSLTGNVILGDVGHPTTLVIKRSKNAKAETILPTPESLMPTNKEQCKNNGWKTFNNKDNKFKNQGDCISFVENKDKNDKEKSKDNEKLEQKDDKKKDSDKENGKSGNNRG